MIAAVVLAAGAASRFGAPKQALLLPAVLERISGFDFGRTVVVLGAYEVEVEEAEVLRCPCWERGPGASLRCGLSVLGPEVEAAVVCLADGPLIAAAAVERVVAAWRAGVGDVVAASYEGLRGHPVVLGRAAWSGVPDAGARALEAALVPCDDLGPPGDVDTPRDLEQIRDRL